MAGAVAASRGPAMVRTGNVGRELAAARADLMVAITRAGWVRICRGVKCSTVMP